MILFKKFFRMIRTHGPISAVRAGLQYLPKANRAASIVATKPRFNGVEPLLSFILSPVADGIRPFQITSEIRSLLELVYTQRPQVVMEIGTANGGTLFLWTRCAAENASLISLDLPAGRYGDGYPQWKGKMYDDFALPGQTISRIRGNSHALESYESVKKTLNGRKIDFLFIDGDHTYAGVKQDYETFSPLVRSGGLIAFHDIVNCWDTSCQVRPLWEEIKNGAAWKEFIEDDKQGWGGIGLLTVK